MQMPSTQNASALLRVQEACDYARVGRTKLYNLINNGAIEAVKIGTATRIVRASLDACLASLPRLGDAQ